MATTTNTSCPITLEDLNAPAFCENNISGVSAVMMIPKDHLEKINLVRDSSTLDTFEGVVTLLPTTHTEYKYTLRQTGKWKNVTERVNVVDADGNPVPVRDENNNIVLYTDENGDHVQATDEEGNLLWVTDDDGNRVQATDEDGQPLTDAEGNPVYTPIYRVLYETEVRHSRVIVALDEAETAHVLNNGRAMTAEEIQAALYNYDEDEGQIPTVSDTLMTRARTYYEARQEWIGNNAVIAQAYIAAGDMDGLARVSAAAIGNPVYIDIDDDGDVNSDSGITAGRYTLTAVPMAENDNYFNYANASYHWMRFYSAKDLGELKYTMQGSAVGNRSLKATLELMHPAFKRLPLGWFSLATNREWVVVVKLKNGEVHLLGDLDNGAILSDGGEATSGKAATDQNGITITFEYDTQFPRILASTVDFDNTGIDGFYTGTTQSLPPLLG